MERLYKQMQSGCRASEGFLGYKHIDEDDRMYSLSLIIVTGVRVSATRPRIRPSPTGVDSAVHCSQSARLYALAERV